MARINTSPSLKRKKREEKLEQTEAGKSILDAIPRDVVACQHENGVLIF